MSTVEPTPVKPTFYGEGSKATDSWDGPDRPLLGIRPPVGISDLVPEPELVPAEPVTVLAETVEVGDVLVFGGEVTSAYRDLDDLPIVHTQEGKFRLYRGVEVMVWRKEQL